ncbi:carbohydrate ABC transporter permease [Paenibacillus antri]|uniref:Carbohydrate ABC transporter permease n=1 Tax=Paenibacillus antri TaxID=2582848 RepID=A0A5R9GH80_9BACL|nr:carbohydrate ABC transporter permease [Paenibacillus antri]TLS52123.1 carbohydrate ABC transporter permease [Paenibacillus antri]
MVIRDRQETVVTVVSYAILLLMTLLCILPFVRLLAMSFSSEGFVQAGQVLLWPKGFTTGAVQFVFGSFAFQRAFWITASATLAFTALALVMTVLTAYPLSRRYLKGARFFSLMIVFTMLFNGGIIPTYLVVRTLGLLDTFWALLIPHMISAFNVIILMSFFRSVPQDFEESAKLDGASNWKVLLHIIVPLSKPVLATITLFYAVFRWNSWFDVLMYVNSSHLYTLQIVLKNLINSSNGSIMTVYVAHEHALLSVQGAAVLFTILPILIVYPFLQKYFVKGVFIGGIKG